MQRHRIVRRLIPLTAAVACFALSLGLSTVAQGQSFLEKLEATVRQQLNTPTAPQPSDDQPPNGREELPAPQGNSDPLQLPSILEGDRRPFRGADAPQQAAQAGNSGAGRIYLGLEAEEVTGGGIGVRVTNVTADSPAWKAGFAINDRIQAINGFAITNLDGMVQQLDKTLPGQTAKFLVSRDGRYVELIAVLMERDLASRIAGSEPPSEEAAGPAWLGVVSSDLSPSFRSQFGIRVFRGAAVTNVSSGSPASKAGLRAGDAIVSIGGKSIENERELTAWLGQARPGTRVEIGYYRGGISQKADVTLEVSPAAKAERVPPPATARSAAATAAAAGVESLVPQIPSSPSPPANSSQLELKPPTAPAPAKDSDAGQPSVVELQQEVKRLQEALRAANARLEATQRKLQQIAEGLGGKQ